MPRRSDRLAGGDGRCPLADAHEQHDALAGAEPEDGEVGEQEGEGGASNETLSAEKSRAFAPGGRVVRSPARDDGRPQLEAVDLITPPRAAPRDDISLDGTTDEPNSSTIRWGNGDVYEGPVKNGKPHGKGVFKYGNGCVYDGEVKDGMPHGKGIFKFTNGDVFDGQWVNGKRNGRGIYTWKDGAAYDGEYQDDQKHGKGVFYYPGGDRYCGRWENGQKLRKGKITFASGNVYEGEFQNDKPHGWGVVEFSRSGDVYMGEWKDGLYGGWGRYSKASGGAAYEGIWTDTACVESTTVGAFDRIQKLHGDLAAEREKRDATVKEMEAKHSEELQLAQKSIAVMKDKLAARVKVTKELERDFAAERRMEKARSASALEELKRKYLVDLMDTEAKLLEEARARAKETDELEKKSEATLAKTEATNVRLDKLEVKVEEELIQLRTAVTILESKLAEKGADLTSIRREIRAAQEQQSRTEGAPCGAGVASGLQTLQEGRAEKKAASKPKSKSCSAMAEKENRENAASDAYDKMIVSKLRKELKKRGLQTGGLKAELQARLRQNDAERASTLIDLCSP
ncbi:hypothetical protein ACHAXT_002672 [Thalassiosira profunda]